MKLGSEPISSFILPNLSCLSRLFVQEESIIRICTVVIVSCVLVLVFTDLHSGVLSSCIGIGNRHIITCMYYKYGIWYMPMCRTITHSEVVNLLVGTVWTLINHSPEFFLFTTATADEKLDSPKSYWFFWQLKVCTCYCYFPYFVLFQFFRNDQHSKQVLATLLFWWHHNDLLQKQWHFAKANAFLTDYDYPTYW